MIIYVDSRPHTSILDHVCQLLITYIDSRFTLTLDETLVLHALALVVADDRLLLEPREYGLVSVLGLGLVVPDARLLLLLQGLLALGLDLVRLDL